MKLIHLAAALVAAVLLPVFSFAQGESLEGKTVSAINVTRTRTSSSEILSRIPLKKGGVWTAEAESKTRRNLHDMGVFRKLDVSSHYDAQSGGVVVDINADDGWYLLPLPLVMSGGGRSGFSVMLLSGNLFHRAETLILRGGSGSGSTSGMAGLATGNWFFSVSADGTDITDNSYADGGYTVSGVGASSVKSLQPVNWYTRKSEQNSFSVSRKLNDNHSVSAFFLQSKYVLKDPAVAISDEPGRHNAAGLGYTFTYERNGGVSKASGGIGGMFGLGLSDLEERLKRRSNVGMQQVVEVKGLRAGNYIGSEYDYSLAQLSWRGTWEFAKHDRLAFYSVASKGWGLPFTQLIPTGNLGLRGQYYREWRGDQGAGGGVSFSYYLSRSKRGVLVMAPFAEGAFVWDGDTRYSQSGAGVNFYYQFWRFPMPLGLGITRSFKDRDYVFSMAAGFGFGK